MKETPKTNGRRQFLKLAGLGSAASAAVVLSADAEAASHDEAATPSADYRETDHVKTFYRLARF